MTATRHGGEHSVGLPGLPAPQRAARAILGPAIDPWERQEGQAECRWPGPAWRQRHIWFLCRERQVEKSPSLLMITGSMSASATHPITSTQARQAIGRRQMVAATTAHRDEQSDPISEKTAAPRTRRTRPDSASQCQGPPSAPGTRESFSKSLREVATATRRNRRSGMRRRRVQGLREHDQVDRHQRGVDQPGAPVPDQRLLHIAEQVPARRDQESAGQREAAGQARSRPFSKKSRPKATQKAAAPRCLRRPVRT